MAAIAAFRDATYRLFEVIAIAFFLLMLGSSLLQVFYRYVLNAPLMWTEELARLMAVGTTYFGGVVVLISREHIRVDIIDTLLPRRARTAIAALCDLLIALFLAAVAWGCVLMVDATWTTFTATMDWFRTAYIYAAVGFAVFVMLLIVLLDAAIRVASLSNHDTETDA